MPHKITNGRDSAGDENPVDAGRQTKIAQLREVIGQIPAFPDKRRSMTPARKRRIHEAHNGLCVWCGDPVEMFGPTVRYDHEIALELGGSDDDSNISPIHRDPCDLIKTANDQALIAKSRRLRKADLEPAEPSRLQGRGFEKPRTKHRWPSRPFPKRRTA